MPGFADSAFIVILALLLFGPKKLPVLARQLGKLMADFRRASNEFRIQMEEELRVSEQTERQKQVAAIEASAPSQSIAAPIPDPEHPHLPLPFVEEAEPGDTPGGYVHEPLMASVDAGAAPGSEAEAAGATLPIATSGELSIHPPATGLPVVRTETRDAPTAQVPKLETQTLHG